MEGSTISPHDKFSNLMNRFNSFRSNIWIQITSFFFLFFLIWRKTKHFFEKRPKFWWVFALFIMSLSKQNSKKIFSKLWMNSIIRSSCFSFLVDCAMRRLSFFLFFLFRSRLSPPLLQNTSLINEFRQHLKRKKKNNRTIATKQSRVQCSMYCT